MKAKFVCFRKQCNIVSENMLCKLPENKRSSILYEVEIKYQLTSDILDITNYKRFKVLPSLLRRFCGRCFCLFLYVYAGLLAGLLTVLNGF